MREKHGAPVGAGEDAHDKNKGVIVIYGDEDQNQLMELIDEHKEEEFETMSNANEIDLITKLELDIQNCKEAIENAEGALAEAERELIEELEIRTGKLVTFDNAETPPDYDFED